MKIEKLDHVNVRTTQLDKMVDWYQRILGLEVGPRPYVSFAGAWLYGGGQALVHLVEVNGEPGAGSEAPLKLEHFALSASGRRSFEEHLVAAGEKFRSAGVEGFGIVQYNIWDPDGNHIHVDFTDED